MVQVNPSLENYQAGPNPAYVIMYIALKALYNWNIFSKREFYKLYRKAYDVFIATLKILGKL